MQIESVKHPEVTGIMTLEELEKYLNQMAGSYLLKDLLTMESVKGADVLYNF